MTPASQILQLLDASNARANAAFPMQGGPTIDWDTAHEIYRVYSCMYGKEQSLERLAQRGGFGWREVAPLFREHELHKAHKLCRCGDKPIARTELPRANEAIAELVKAHVKAVECERNLDFHGSRVYREEALARTLAILKGIPQ
jgi:hypothetical protein